MEHANDFEVLAGSSVEDEIVLKVGDRQDAHAREQLLLQALLFHAFYILPDEPPDVITRRAVVGCETALFDELFEVFWEQDGHGACSARHRVRNIRNYCDFFTPL